MPSKMNVNYKAILSLTPKSNILQMNLPIHDSIKNWWLIPNIAMSNFQMHLKHLINIKVSTLTFGHEAYKFRGHKLRNFDEGQCSIGLRNWVSLISGGPWRLDEVDQ